MYRQDAVVRKTVSPVGKNNQSASVIRSMAKAASVTLVHHTVSFIIYLGSSLNARIGVVVLKTKTAITG